jgi:hypothetical protein
MALTTQLAGCATMALSSHSYDIHEHSKGAETIFIWDSKYSAGMGTEYGVCAEGALTAVANSGSLAAKLTDNSANLTGQGGAEFRQSLTLLNATSVQTAYANIGYFYACQIALNNAKVPESRRLSGDEVVAMFRAVGDTASKLAAANAVTPASITAPESVAVVNEMLKSDGVVGKTDDQVKSDLAAAQAKVITNSQPAAAPKH